MIRITKLLSTIWEFLVDRISSLFALMILLARQRPCLLCDDGTSSQARICSACAFDLPWNSYRCRVCAIPLNTQSSSIMCGACLKQQPSFELTLCCFNYDFPIRQLLHRFKFLGQRFYLRPLVQCLAEEVKRHYQDQPAPQLLVPAPMDCAKRKTRPYNHAELLARALGKTLNLPVDCRLLVKHRNTASQTSLSKAQRLRNLEQAFSLSKAVDSSHVAIIDDVMTTGATAECLAKTLHQAGVEKVDIWCIARTPKS